MKFDNLILLIHDYLFAHWQWGGILSLRDRVWINDEIVNAYCSMVVEDAHLGQSKHLMCVSPYQPFLFYRSFTLYYVCLTPSTNYLAISRHTVVSPYHLQWGCVFPLFWAEVEWRKKMDRSIVKIASYRVILAVWRCIFPHKRQPRSLGAHHCVSQTQTDGMPRLYV